MMIIILKRLTKYGGNIVELVTIPKTQVTYGELQDFFKKEKIIAAVNENSQKAVNAP